MPALNHSVFYMTDALPAAQPTASKHRKQAFGVVIWDEVQTCILPSRSHCHSLSLAPVNPDWFYLPGF